MKRLIKNLLRARQRTIDRTPKCFSRKNISGSCQIFLQKSRRFPENMRRGWLRSEQGIPAAFSAAAVQFQCKCLTPHDTAPMCARAEYGQGNRTWLSSSSRSRCLWCRYEFAHCTCSPPHFQCFLWVFNSPAASISKIQIRQVSNNTNAHHCVESLWLPCFRCHTCITFASSESCALAVEFVLIFDDFSCFWVQNLK